MSIGSRLLADFYKLPPRLCGAIRTRNIRVPMRDGVTLETEHYAPRRKGEHPTILMRLPYGTTGFSTVAECYAERGYHVVLRPAAPADRRGIRPAGARARGRARHADWLKRQDWYDGRLGTAAELPRLCAVGHLRRPAGERGDGDQGDERRIPLHRVPGGALHLSLWLNWLQTVDGIRNSPQTFVQRMISGGVERCR